MVDEKQKYNNIKTAMADPKTRTIYIVGVSLVIVIAVFAVLSLKKSVPRGEFPADEVPTLPKVQTNVSNGDKKQATPVYDKLIKTENQQEAEKAKADGASALPVMRTPVEQKPAAQPQTPAPVSAYNPQSQTQDNAVHEEEQKRQQAIKDRMQLMRSQVNLLVASWAPKGHVNMTVEAKEKIDSQGAATTPALKGAATAGSAVARSPLKKAGDTCYAELDTFVNTDEPSPVFATIQQCGELDQSKLIGKVEIPQNTQYAQKAVLRFTQINVPGQSNSLTVDVVAIDEVTRRTALATDVDNHYFLRYGALFGSSFLSGYADALLKGGQNQSIVTTTTGAIIQNTAYDTRQMVQAGLGNIGKQVAANMGGLFNRPPTITIDDKANPGSHIGIGIVFMSDLTLK